MAIFASTTTSGYSDPLKALSIKALEKRQADIMAQNAAQQPDAASMATIPGGIGHVLGVIGDQMKESRNMQAVAAQREALSRTIAGMKDPLNPTAQEQSVIATTDPDMYKQMLTTLAENRRQAAGFAHDDTYQKAGFEHADTTQAAKTEAEKAAAAEAARVQEQARQQGYTHADAAAAQKVLDDQVAADAAEKRIQARPSEDPAAQVLRAQERKELPPEVAERRLDQVLAKKPAEEAKIAEMQKGNIDTQSGLRELEEARGLMNSKEGIHAGRGAGIKTGIGGYLPESMGGPSEATQANTKRFNQILAGQGMQALLKMKGASSDQDVQISFEIINDPNATLLNKQKAMDTLITKLSAYEKIERESLGRVGATVPTLPGGSTTADPAKVNSRDPAVKTSADPAKLSDEDIAASLANAQKAVASGRWTVEQANAKLKAAGVPTLLPPK